MEPPAILIPFVRLALMTVSFLSHGQGLKDPLVPPGKVTLIFVCNTDAVLQMDDRKIHLIANQPRKEYLNPGEYLFSVNANPPCRTHRDELFKISPDLIGKEITKNFLLTSDNYIPEIKKAIAEGNLKHVSSLINCGFDVNEKKELGLSFLHIAAKEGQVNIAKYLLSKGADVNSKASADERTPLHEAVISGKKEIVKLLIDSGADINAKTKPFKTSPLTLALKHNQTAIAKLLEQFGGLE